MLITIPEKKPRKAKKTKGKTSAKSALILNNGLTAFSSFQDRRG